MYVRQRIRRKGQANIQIDLTKKEDDDDDDCMNG